MKDKLFIDIAKRVAEESKCISLQVGAVIVKDNRIISMGYNGTVSGTLNCNEAFETKQFNREDHTEWSNSHEIHAEMNALMFAAREGLSVKDCTLYCTHEPCDQCLKNIIQAGIKEVIYLNPYKADRCKSEYRNSNAISINQYKENKSMELTVKRIALRDTYTIGKLYVDGVYLCDTLEDKVIDTNKNGVFDGNEKKVYGESAIPYGRYKVIVNVSPKFKRELPRLLDVPHFEGILIHSGNTALDSAGCILVGENTIKGKVTNSRHWEKIVTDKIKSAISNGNEVFISIE